MAKRSATECSSIMDILKHLQLVEEQAFTKARELLARTVAMLIRMMQKLATYQGSQMPSSSQMCGTGSPEKKLTTVS